MRAISTVTLAALLLFPQGCTTDHGQPEWMQLPESYQPQSADLTFNKAGLERFNKMSESEREAFQSELEQKKGSFKGQAVFVHGTGLTESIEESKYGSYELIARTDPVLFEITLDYAIYTTPELGKKLARNKAIEFTGTLVGLEYQHQDKPRKLSLKIRADDVKTLQ